MRLPRTNPQIKSEEQIHSHRGGGGAIMNPLPLLPILYPWDLVSIDDKEEGC